MLQSQLRLARHHVEDLVLAFVLVLVAQHALVVVDAQADVQGLEAVARLDIVDVMGAQRHVVGSVRQVVELGVMEDALVAQDV